MTIKDLKLHLKGWDEDLPVRVAIFGDGDDTMADIRDVHFDDHEGEQMVLDLTMEI